jgi:DNA repair protein RadA/Sms
MRVRCVLSSPGRPCDADVVRATSLSKGLPVAKIQRAFFCSACGHESARWLGRCPGCQEWNTFAEAPVQQRSGAAARPRLDAPARPTRLGDVATGDVARIATGFDEFDGLLGGGIVPGSLVLVGGPPGAGKSTLLLQVAGSLAQRAARIVYVTGEESAAQTKLRAQRLGVSDDTLVLAETDADRILAALEDIRPTVVVVDSIQTLARAETESYAGSVAQVRECAAALLAYAKGTGCAIFMIGHVTKDGAIAGPRLLEHIVDTVLYFEGDGDVRILRAHKNRFGNAEEICVFRMDERGLHEIHNPSALFLGGAGARTARASGACVVASVVGSRPLLIEIQALVGETNAGSPRRLTANLDPARFAMVVAVLERRAGMHLGAHDIYASVAGGLRVDEPATDLGVALAIASAFRNVPLAADSAVFGELGLAGDVRPVPLRARRVAEARRLGFSTVIAPPGEDGRNGAGVGAVRDVAAAIRAALG